MPASDASAGCVVTQILPCDTAMPEACTGSVAITVPSSASGSIRVSVWVLPLSTQTWPAPAAIAVGLAICCTVGRSLSPSIRQTSFRAGATNHAKPL